MSNRSRPLPQELLHALASLQTPEQVAAALEDLLSPAERSAVAERWQIVVRLVDGASQRAVRDEVGCSIATVSRGALLLQRGGDGIGVLLRARPQESTDAETGVGRIAGGER